MSRPLVAAPTVDTGGWPINRPGLGFLEGPVWDGDDLIATGFDSGLLFRLSGPNLEHAEVEAVVGGGPNGATLGPDGAIYVAQSGGHGAVCRQWPGITGGIQVVRDGQVSYLTQDPVSPNDLVFGPDGYLYVTDPTRGPRPGRDGRLWRVDPGTGQTTLLASTDYHVNGLAFDAARALYVADTFGRRLVRHTLDGAGWPTEETTFASWDQGLPDGMAIDDQGNFIVCAIGENDTPADLIVLNQAGTLIERRPLDTTSDECTNIAIHPDGRTAITDSTTGTIIIL
ncbi:MAG: SMP-30/gluconolactonase/LRE family protein [Propionibacteriaceae bacterium]|jgi:gluconolactonase|nr:SMP-30/gluconolactonase/LRE family protein [Propionibacteriaceae bacterium]